MSLPTRRRVAAALRGDYLLRVYRSCDKLRDKLQRQIVFCVLENFCENLCFSNRILSPQQLTRIQSDLLLCDSLRRQNSVAETKIFAKVLQLTRSDLPL